MRASAVITAMVLILLPLVCPPAAAEPPRRLVLENSDSFRVHRDDQGREVWFGYGNVRFRLDSTFISSDSVIWEKDVDRATFFGRVEAYDTIQYLSAQKVTYFHRDSLLLAEGNVILINRSDSIRAEGQRARFDHKDNILHLESSPRLYLGYPDSSRLVTVTADRLTYLSGEKQGKAEKNVVIEHKDTRATCGLADFDMSRGVLTLTEAPYAVRGRSDLRGREMEIVFDGSEIRQINVADSAQAMFVEEEDTLVGDLAGESYLTAGRIGFIFKDEEIRRIDAAGAAQSKYFPPPDDTTGAGKNFVSGDSIVIYVKDRKTSKVEVRGGAEGVYITPVESSSDSITAADSLVSGSPEETVVPPESYASKDTLTTDSTAADSLVVGSTGPEDSIHYQGNLLEFEVAERLLRMTGGAIARQQDVVLEAGEVEYEIRKRVLMARAETDSLADSAIVKPLVLRDGREELRGTRLVFNVDSRRGLIEDATTRYENASYHGQDLYKEEAQVFYVADGDLTPCEPNEATVRFVSRRMKLIQDDRVIARPVVMYIETLPVMALPYYVFPLKRGRHSGILAIKLGNFEQGNRYIGNLGYYWAASEYWDVETALDFYENIGITINGLFRYNKRYAYSGQIRGSISRENRESAYGETKSRRWTLTGNHTQTLPYDISFQASGTFVSDRDYYTDYSTNPDERLNRSIISKANFNKRFGGASLSLSFSHTNNLDADSRSSALPTGSLTLPSFHPFGSGSEVNGLTIRKWYQYLYLGYRNSFAVNTQRSSGSDGPTRKEYAYLDHSISFSAAQKVLEYFNISPSMSIQETWYYILPTDQAYEAGIPAQRPYRRGAISAGVSTNTNLYGTFPVGLAGLSSLRHVFTPSVGFTWAPAVTKNDLIKNYVRRGGGGSRQMALSLGVTNLLQAKIRQNETDKKYDLLRVSSGLSHNFEGVGKKWSDLSTSFSSSLIENLDLSGSMAHTFYDDDGKFKWTKPRLESFSVASTFQARGSVADDYVRQGLGSELAADTSGQEGSGLNYDTSTPAGSDKTSWNLRLSHRYSEYGLLTSYVTRSHWIQVTFNMNLTSNWKIKYNQNYDIVNHHTTEKVIDLYRRLPCWEGHFYWIPEGSRKGYYFKINVIAIPDIKAEKSESGLRGALLGR